MSKLITAMLLTVLIFGIAVYIFQGGNAPLTDKARLGHNRVADVVRSFDYVGN
jgi:hypothetical protein